MYQWLVLEQHYLWSEGALLQSWDTESQCLPLPPPWQVLPLQVGAHHWPWQVGLLSWELWQEKAP